VEVEEQGLSDEHVTPEDEDEEQQCDLEQPTPLTEQKNPTKIRNTSDVI
jgi:hypothetical protein